MAKQSGIFTGGDTGLMSMALKAGLAMTPADLSGTFEKVGDAYAEGVEKLGEGYAKAAELAATQAAKLLEDENRRTVGDAVGNFFRGVEGRISPDSPFSGLASGLADVIDPDIEFTPMPGGDVSSTINVNGEDVTYNFTSTGDFVTGDLKAAGANIKLAKNTYGKNSEQHRQAKKEYRDLYRNFRKNQSVLEVNEQIYRDAIKNNNYHVQASAKNLPFVRALLMKGAPLEDGSRVVQGVDANGNVALTWLDKNGVIIKDDNDQPYTIDANRVNGLITLKDATALANTETINNAAAVSGKSDVNNVGYEKGFKSKYINATRDGVLNSEDPKTYYANAIYNTTGFMETSFAQDISGITYKNGELVIGETIMTDAMMNSLKGLQNIIDDTDNSGDVSAGDFATVENLEKLQQHLMTYTPTNAAIYASWMGETEGKRQYEDGKKRIKKTNITPPNNKTGLFPNLGVGGVKLKDFVSTQAADDGEEVGVQFTKEDLVGLRQRIGLGLPIEIGNTGFEYSEDGWNVYDLSAGKELVTSQPISVDSMINQYFGSTLPDLYVQTEREFKKQKIKPFKFSKSNLKTIDNMFKDDNTFKEKQVVASLKDMVSDYPNVAAMITVTPRGGSRFTIKIGDNTYSVKNPSNAEIVRSKITQLIRAEQKKQALEG